MKTTIAILTLILGVVSTGWATMYAGSLTSLSGGGLFANGDWAGGTTSANSSLSWRVDDTPTGYWTYVYTFTAASKDLSHIIIEVSDSFTDENIISGTTTGGESPSLDTFGPDSQGGSNPNMPGSLYGLKWNTQDIEGSDPLAFQFTIVTDREPMWGDFYAVDGKNDPIPYAYNTGFGFDTLAAIGDGNAFDSTNGRAWLLVPDTNGGGGTGDPDPVPEPSTFVLLGSGLLGLFYAGRRRSRK